MSFALAALVRATLALLASLAAAYALRRAAAATRHTTLVAGQLAALVVPLLAFVVPPVRVDVAPPVVARDAAPPLTRELSTHVPAAESRSTTNPWPFVWIAGVIVVLLHRGHGWIAAMRLVRRQPSPLRRGEKVPKADEGASAHANIRISNEVTQPLTFGRHILLPTESTTWSKSQLDAVLAHERAHVARRDSLQALIGDAVCALYWFHPLAWLSAKQAALAREQACDDAVLAQGIARDAYASAILDVARSLQRRVAHALPMATRSQLEVRLRAILDERRAAPARSARVAVIVIAIAGAPLLAALTLRGIEPDLLGDAYASPFSEHIAIARIPNVPASGPDAALIARMHELARRTPESDIDFVADRARWALTRVVHGELVMPLIASLHDDDWRIRAYAAWGLAVARDARATNALLPLMNDRIWRVRSMAAVALAEIADPAAAPAMQRALDDDAWQVRKPAVDYFRAIHTDRALFQRMLEDRHVAVRTAAQEALE